MVRTIVAILLGVFAGAIIVALVEGASHIIWPPPEGNLQDPEFLKSIMHEIPFGAKMGVLVAWGLGVFGGGIIARFISHRHTYAAWTVGVIILGFGMMTMIAIPHPTWMIFNAFVFTLIGILLANRVTRA